MHVGYAEMRRTPLNVILRDLEYIGIENSVEAGKVQQLKDAKS